MTGDSGIACITIRFNKKLVEAVQETERIGPGESTISQIADIRYLDNSSTKEDLHEIVGQATSY